SDTQKVVIAPIEKMVNIVKQLADDPLRKPETEVDEKESKSSDDGSASEESGNNERLTTRRTTRRLAKTGSEDKHMETTLLESTILRIGSLLRVGFGQAGAQIICNNMSQDSGNSSGLNMMLPGRRVEGVYAYCDIRQFDDTAKCLLEETVSAAASRRISSASIRPLTANTPRPTPGNVSMPRKISVVRLKEINNEREKAKKELTERALLGCIKIIAEIRRAGDLKAYAKHPKLIPKFGLSYQVDVGIALHSGWSVEGAIGSEMKIDATYIGFNVSVARSLLKALPLYGCSLLLTESVVENLGNKTRDRCRLIDEVRLQAVARLRYYDNAKERLKWSEDVRPLLPEIAVGLFLTRRLRNPAWVDLGYEALQVASIVCAKERDLDVGLVEDLRRIYSKSLGWEHSAV
ncbi:conserved hypothetical protein, partial [Perkinsus marinus ATCC 50983]